MWQDMRRSPADPDPRTEKDVYVEGGCLDAWEIIRTHREHPPSFEVFRHGYMQSMASTPEEYAEMLIALHS